MVEKKENNSLEKVKLYVSILLVVVPLVFGFFWETKANKEWAQTEIINLKERVTKLENILATLKQDINNIPQETVELIRSHK